MIFVCLHAACGDRPAQDPARAADTPPVVDTRPPDYEGAHDTADCGGITGWVRDRNHPGRIVTVDIYEGDTRIGSATADRLRKDLLDAGIGTGRYGFAYDLRAPLRDGKSHTIRVKISGADLNLRNTPRDAQCRPDEHAYEGAHDTADCSAVTGWIRDKNHPDATVAVDVYDGNTRIATLNADALRKDLLDAGVGNGMFGFTYTLPPGVKDGRPHSLRIKVAGTALDIPNTPKTIACSANR